MITLVRWFVLALLLLTASCRDKTPTCAAMASHVYDMFKPADQFAQDVEGAFLGACVEDKWPAAMRTCIFTTRSLVEPQNCKSKLTPEQAATLQKALDKADEANVARTLPQVCTRYGEVLAQLLTCESFPKSERDALKQRYEVAKRDWDKLADKSGLGAVCSGAISALKQAASECPGARDW